MGASRKLGIVGTVVGLVTAGAGTAVAVQQRRASTARAAPDGRAGTAFGRLPADRSYRVRTDDGLELHVEEVGAPDAELVLIFVHGFTLALGSWHYQRLGLAGPGRRLVFCDLRSHGRSGRGTAESCDIDQLGRDVGSVLDATAGERPVVLVGHSMGGMALLALAEQRPELFGEQVRAVALLSTSSGGMAGVDLGLPKALSSFKLVALPLLARGMRARPKLAELTRRLGSDLSWSLTRAYSFGDPQVSPSLVDYVGRMIADTPVEVIADFFATLMGHDKVAALPVLRAVDTLVVCGGDDRITPLSHSESIAAALPATRLLEIDGAGHLAMLEQPVLVNAALEELVVHAAIPGSRSC